jgi:hypothetical protein
VLQAQSPSLPAVDLSSHADLITQVNALAAGCRGSCTIRIPAGTYEVASGTILIHRYGLSLAGDGRNNTLIRYHGLNFLDSRLTGTDYGESLAGAGTISGFTLVCTNLAAKCITAGSVVGQRWEDLTLIGPSSLTEAAPVGSTAEAFVFQNTFNWMERTVFRDITVGGFTVNFHFMAPKGGTDSFGYARFDGIYTNQGARSRNFVVDAGAGLYNVLDFSMQFNSSGTTEADEVFSIAGAFTGVGFHVTGENAGAPITFAHVRCGGTMNFEGDYNIFGGTVKTDCTQAKEAGSEPFRVAPRAGLFGVKGSARGVGALTNWNNTGKSYSLWIDSIFDPPNPAAVGYNGFVSEGGKVSPLTVYDWDLGYCVAARTIYSTPNSAQPRLCVDGPGNVTAAGLVRTPAVVTTRGTPASSHEACVLGESWDDDNFHYHCTKTGIKRLALNPF